MSSCSISTGNWGLHAISFLIMAALGLIIHIDVDDNVGV